MAWPYSAVTPIKQELFIDGAWVDITDDTRGADKPVIISRGYSSAQASASAGTIGFALDNADGKYSPRNPLSPYWGLLPRNVPHRCSITLATTSLRLTDTSVVTSGDYDGARAWTADKASLDITGDIDMRIDAEADDWYGRMGHILAAKYNATGNQRSWVFGTTPTGYLQFAWSTDGTSTNRIAVTSTVPIATIGRQVFRVTLDVNNGAAGNTATFYTGDTVGGTFTQLGSAVVTSGTTSIFSSTANLEVGSYNDGGGRGSTIGTLDVDPFTGKIYAFQLRSSIAGTVVATMDATAQAVGTTSWADASAAPNTWALTASAEITNADYRFHSEIYEFPSEWDNTGTDVYASINASDVVERLTSGQKPLRSPIFRNLSQYASDGYWPMEDDFSSTTQIAAYVGKPGYVTDGAFGTATDLPGTAGALTFTSDSGYASGQELRPAAATGTGFSLWYFKMTTIPGSSVEFFATYYSGGTVYKATVNCDATTFTLNFRDASGAVLATSASGFGAGAEPDQWLAMRLKLTQSGGTINWEWAWYPIGAPVLYGQSGSFSGTFGRPWRWISWYYTGKTNLLLAHVAIARIDLGFNGANFISSTNGYIGESARERAKRLAAEQSVPFWWIGPQTIQGDDASVPMGVQGTLAFPDLLQECVAADGGIIYAPRDKFGLCIRSYYSMLNRGYPTLNYTSKHLSGKLTPRELRDIKNDVTITRTGGTSGRAVKTDGPNGTVLAGTYDQVIPRNASADDQLTPMAEREVFLGTWDELRQTGMQVELHRAPLVADATLSAQIAALDIGAPVAVSNIPLYAGGPNDAICQVLGYAETLGNKTRGHVFNTVPYGPYLVGMYGALGRRYAAKFTTLKTTVNSSATSLVFTMSDARETWSTTNEPYDVIIAGERITVTSMAALSGSDQMATVTRGVNGISKSISAGEVVQIWMPARYAMKPRGPR